MPEALLLRVCLEGVSAGFIAVAFAMLFSVPSRYLGYVAVGGLVTRVARTLLFNGLGVEVAIATFMACCLCSVYFIYQAPKLHVPRPVFTVASIIPIVPGMDAYTCLMSLYGIIDAPADQIAQNAYLIMHHGMRCFAILLSMCLGIAIPPLFFYRYRRIGV
ncbi:MAG: threonine/serine exporter family protein [Succinivibrio sp.]